MNIFSAGFGIGQELVHLLISAVNLFEQCFLISLFSLKKRLVEFEIFIDVSLLNTLFQKKFTDSLMLTVSLPKFEGGYFLHSQSTDSIEQCILEPNARKQLSYTATDV